MTVLDAPVEGRSSTQSADGVQQSNQMDLSSLHENSASHVDVDVHVHVPSLIRPTNTFEGQPGEPTCASSSSSGTGAASVASDPQLLEQHLAASTASLSDALERLSRSRAEEESCIKKAQMEELRLEETTEWMLAMQGVLWPENEPDRELGRPVLPDQSPSTASNEEVRKGTAEAKDDGVLDEVKASAASSAVIEMDLDADDAGGAGTTSAEPVQYAFYAPVPCPPNRASVSLSKSKDFLTYGMCNALDAARMLRILEVVDVDTTMEAFRWMAWCFRCLHVLRIPPATHTLKRLLACCKPFKLADDKIMKAVGGILSRSLVWKGRVRKLIFPGVRLSRPTLPLPHLNVNMDTTRLHLLIAEGGMVPMTSKLKDHLVRTWDEAVLRASNAPAIPSQSIPHSQSVDGSVLTTGKSKRTVKTNSIPPVSGIAKSIIISMAGDVAESSDDDDGDAAEEDSKRPESNNALKVADDAPMSSSATSSSSSSFSSSSSSSSSAVPRMDTAPSPEGRKKLLHDRELARSYVYTTLSPSMWAPLPSLWPPALSVRQISAPSSNAPLMKCSINSSSSTSSPSTDPLMSDLADAHLLVPVPVPVPVPVHLPLHTALTPPCNSNSS